MGDCPKNEENPKNEDDSKSTVFSLERLWTLTLAPLVKCPHFELWTFLFLAPTPLPFPLSILATRQYFDIIENNLVI